MAQPFSEETLELFDRGQQAIDRATGLREQHDIVRRSVRRTVAEMELRRYLLERAVAGNRRKGRLR